MEYKRLKVVLFSTQWPEYMLELANALSMHCDIYLFQPKNHRWSERHTELLNSSVTLCQYNVVWHKSYSDNLPLMWEWKTRITQINPNIVHIQANGHRWFWPLYFFLIGKGIKYFNTIHDPVHHLGDNVSKTIQNRMSQLAAKWFCKGYFVHGNTLATALSTNFNIKLNKIHVIPHGNFGVYKKFQKRNVSEEKNTILLFGRIWPYKGVDVFIKAANILLKKYSYLKFIIAGGGENIDHYIKLIEKRNSFEIYNYRIPMNEAGLFFERSSLVVMPYKDASQSGIIPVAFAYGKPVIASDVGAISEVLIDQFNGILVQPECVEDLTRAIERMILDKSLRDKIKKNAFVTAQDNLSWNKIARMTIKAYNA